MSKRHAFSLLTFLGYCFFSLSSFAMEIAMDLEKEQTSLKNETNSNSIDTKFFSTGQEESDPYKKYQEQHLENLRDSRNKINKSDLTDQNMADAFLGAYKPNSEGFRTPVKINELTFYLPHGFTPQKIPGSTEYTPRRKRNHELMLNGESGIYVCKTTNEIIPLEAHHVEKNNEGHCVWLPKETHRGGKKNSDLTQREIGNSDLMHHRPGLPSRIIRSEFEKDKQKVKIHYGNLFSIEIDETNNDGPSKKKIKKDH